MTNINEYETKNPDQVNSPLVGLYSTDHVQDIGFHSHEKTQLVYIKKGFIEIYLEDRLFLIPKDQAALIPSGVRHRGLSTSECEYFSLYFDLNAFNLPISIKNLSVSQLLASAISRVPNFPSSYDLDSPSFHIALVIADEINRATNTPFSISLPTDKRCKQIVTDIKLSEDKMPSLEKIAANIGASPRTITRIFKLQTGLTFEKWRQRYLIIRAVTLLTEGYTTTSIAQKLGYSNDSAFIAMFKRLTGKTPSKYRV